MANELGHTVGKAAAVDAVRAEAEKLLASGDRAGWVAYLEGVIARTIDSDAANQSALGRSSSGTRC